MKLRHRRLRDQQSRDKPAVGSDTKVAEVARMEPFRVAMPVLLSRRIPVGSGSRELGSFASADLMQVNPVQPRRKASSVDAQHEPCIFLEDTHRSDAGSVASHEGHVRDDDIGRRHRHASRQQKRQCQNVETHDSLLRVLRFCPSQSSLSSS